MVKKKRKTGMLRLLEIAGTKKWWLIGSIILAILSSIAQFIPYVSVYKILEELALNASSPVNVNEAKIWNLGLIALGSFASYGILLFCALMMSHVAAFNILYEMRVLISRKLVKLPLGYFTKKSSGQIKKIMSEDVERIELFVAHHIPDIVSALIFPIMIIGYMFIIDWRPAIVVLVIFIFAISLMSKMSANPKMKPVIEKYLSIMGQMNGSIVEYVRGISVVKVFNKSTNAFKKLNEDIDEFLNFSNKVTKQYSPVYLNFNMILSSLLFFLIPVLVFILIKSESYTSYIPTFLMFLILGGGIFFPVLKLMWIGGMMGQNNVGIDMIDEIIYQDEISDPEIANNPKDSTLEFKNVSFSYEKTEILHDVNFKAKPGKITALVGPSGSGKSTIAMLASRFWDIQKGEILLGGINIKEISIKDLMKHVSFVFQDNFLFFDSIEENIRMGNKEASFDEVVKAARIANCHEFIEKLENGYRTLVGEGGTYLSGGEAQRIAIARAVLKNSPIVLLDEATAYADPENEGKILTSLSHLTKDKTVLIIAHRLSTITCADNILFIDNGKIIEQGRHDDLLKLKGKYYKMWNIYNDSREWAIANTPLQLQEVI
ncbi:MAG: ABC transporter ATP-binding protein [Candidatus Delongbacteria bacterium]|nr:ABC transporter ATP-binding protein [Candidatus Delongbacteria bacterium]MBN2833464.1 ABC transporter ATP-binding protein [Candidatus Delongbacteria bacterium]